MPLVRFEVRNEYKLGGSQLYKDGVLAEDPKPVLDGLTVAGLVGILRQLGDLAEFAAEVFHGLQEQVASTSSRSRKLVTRVQRIEASLPQLEKAILSQTSHIHYAYTPGCSLHARIRNPQNHFICDDLPSFIMDSYEESREPPRLQLLDRFDTGGPGSCLKRYSDPTFFRRASASSEVCNVEKPLHERKTRKMKRRRTWKHSENSRKNSPFSKDSERMQSPAPIAQGPCSVSHTESTVDTTCKSDVVDSLDLGSKDVMDYIECELHPSSSVQTGAAKSSEPSSVQNGNTMGAHDSIYVYGQNCGAYSPSLEETVPHSSVTGDDKMVSGEYIHLNYGTNDLEYLIETKSDHDRELKDATVGCFDQVDYLNGHKSPSKSDVDNHFLKTTVNDIQDAQKENVDLVKPKLRLVEASVNTVEDSSERESVTDLHADENYPRTIVGTQPDYAIDEAQDMADNYELHEHDLGPATTECIAREEDFPRSENTSKLISDDCLVNDSLDRKWETIDEVHYAEPHNLGLDSGIDDVQYMLENIELHEHGLGPATTDCIAQVEDLSRGESSARLISNESPRNDSLDRKWETIDDARFVEPSQLYGLNFGIDDVRYMLENFEPHELDLGLATTECRSQVEELSRGENYSEMLSDGSPINDPFERTLTVSQIDDVTNNFDTVDEKLETINTEPVSEMDALPESENAVTVIEWNQLDDVDSETDQFVDALNTIESESESDFEGQTKKELISYSSCKDELVEYAEFVQKEELINHQQLQRELSCPSNDDEENDIQNSNALATSINMESLGHADSSCHVSVAAMISLFEPEHESDSVSFNYKEEVCDPSSAVVPMESIEHDQSPNNVVEAKISQLTSLQELERECDSVSLDDKEQVPDASFDANAAVSLDSIEHPQSSCEVSAEITSPQKAEVHSCDVVSDQKQQISDDSHNSAAPMSSPIVEPVVHTLSSYKQSAAEEDNELDHSTCLSDEQPAQHIQSCDVVAEEISCVQKPEVKSRDVVSDQMQQISDDSHNSAAPMSSLIAEPVVHAQSSGELSAAEEGNELDHTTYLNDEQSVQHIQSSSDPAEETVGAPHLSQGISVGSSSTYPPAFWTNGTLFGLQPSKPTVLSSPKTVNSNPISKTNVLNNMKKVENSAAGASSLKDPRFGHGSIEPTMGNQDAENFSHCSHQTSDKQYEKSIGHDLSNLSNGRITHHEVKAPSTANVENVSTVAINTRQEKPSLITLLGRELLRNGLRAGSFDYSDKSNTTIPIPNELENRSHASTLHSTPETISKGKLNSPVSSPPPSPPLDHMKISFRPIDGFGTSRLKLKYPEGINQHELIVDSFPSFQLVPEPSNLKAETGSDSDDDTFCRSYACMSDDYLGHLSDSNSDEWESGETSESNDPALYDGLRRISSTEFASSSPQCEETDQGSINVCSISGHVVHSGSSPSFHLPTFGSQIPFSHKESTVCLHTEEIETPPFPPVQWRVSKPVLDPKVKQGQGSDSFNQPFHPNLSGPTIADLSKLDSAKQFKSKELATIPNTNELDEQQLNPRSLNNEVTNVERVEDMDGFLHQIRKKSFNLRRTETARSSYMQNNTTNNKVTAILQKANAIRQAVASDGDDDSWSDT